MRVACKNMQLLQRLVEPYTVGTLLMFWKRGTMGTFLLEYVSVTRASSYSWDWLVAADLLAAASICPAPGGPPVGVAVW